MVCKHKKLILVVSLFFAAFLFPAAAKSEEHVEKVEGFLKRTPLSQAEQFDVVEGIKTAPSRTQWLMTGGGEIYSMALCRVEQDRRANVQAKLEEMARTRASARARYLLYLRAAPAARKARYANEESMAEALAGWDAGRQEEERLKPDISAAIVSDGWAFAILRAKGELLDLLTVQLQSLPESALDTAYCAALYPKAKMLFDAGEYKKALPVYRELHSLKWAKPAAYLDAAECFLYTGDSGAAGRLARETVTELNDAMSSAALERAGDILLEAGEEKSAESVYRLAIEKMRQES